MTRVRALPGLSLLLLLFFLLHATECFSQVSVTEFQADNSSTLADENGSFEDWIEIHNDSGTNVNLLNWSLTDNAGNLTKWRFPATNLPPNGYRVVFASNKDRHTAGAPLHTNFKLDAAGEYLALARPDGSVASQFSPKYPPQFSDVSYGLGMQIVTTPALESNAPARWKIPADASLESSWMLPDFEDEDWTRGTNGVGYETGITDAPQVSFTPYLKTDIQSAMYGFNSSAYVRIPFVVTDPSQIDALALELRYDDGFVAYLNGQEIARQNAADPIAWNSLAIQPHGDDLAVQWASFNVSAARFLLQTGTNVLAIQGLNLSSTNVDFLLQARLLAARSEPNGSVPRYFTQPSPGGPNGFGQADLGPILFGVGHAPLVPQDANSLTVTARVEPALLPVSTVTLHYRVMFNPEVLLPMNDAGSNGDAVSGDHIWTGIIPASAAAPGQLVRYYITATDTTNRQSRWPIFASTSDSQEYLGTVIEAPSIASQLPVVHLFVEDFATANSGPTTRAAIFYLNELYDNVAISRHGQSSAGWPKKSYNLDFTSDHRFLYQPDGFREKDIKLLSNYGDKTRMHTTLTYEKIAEAGGAAHFSFQVRVQTNGAFFGIEDFVEDADDLWLDRLGRNPNGALYKMYNAMTSASGNEKKTRTEEGNSDLTALINNLNESLPLGDRVKYACDNLDLPQTISYFATLAIVSSQDHGHKNYYLYRDSDVTGEWAILPWDVDLSWGRNWLDSGGYFTDTLFTNNVLNFYNPAQQSRTANRLYNLIFNHPDFRGMYLRRLRTLMDTMLKPPGTPPNQFNIEPRIRQLADLLDPTNAVSSDGDLDRAKWGPNWGDTSLSDLRVEAERTISTYLGGRRSFLYNDPSATLNGERVPSAQPAQIALTIASWDYNPASGNQDEEYVELHNANAFAADISGWKLGGGVKFTFKGGTVIPPGASLFVSPNVTAFRARTTGPRGGQGLYVQGPYDGQLNAWGESLTLTDANGSLVTSNGFTGTPSPAQRYLRITEIMYNPVPAPAITNDAQQFEYLELKNISTNVMLNLAGVRFTNGIFFNFTGSAVTSLLPGQTVLLVRNTNTFAARYGGGFNLAGQFTGTLDNGGETLRIEDAVGEKILEFDYEDDWYPITDGLGFSLVIIDENAPWDTWGKKTSWRASGTINGSPGVADPPPPVFSPVIVNEVLTHTDLPDLDSVELLNPTATAVNIGGWFLTDDFLTPKKYRIASGTTIPAGGYLVITENQFNTGTNAFRLSELGEDVYLFSADAGTNLTGYYHGYEFGEAPNGVSFGRYTNSQDEVHFVLENAVTLGTSNAYPRVGPIVISEIMYRPPDTNGADNDLDEFIELQNLAATNVPLYGLTAATNTWRLRNAVDFDFPTNQSLAAATRLLVVGFNPTNAAQLTAFRAKYGVSNSVPVFGPWNGKLDNSGETIELKQPGPPDDTTNVPYYMIDKVAYQDAAPWPAGADGIGNSLQRLANTGYGNDPTNWFAAGVSAGRATLTNIAPAVSILAPTNGTSVNIAMLPTISISATDSNGSIALVKLWDGETLLAQWTNPPFNFTWANPAGGPHVLRAYAYDNLGAAAASEKVNLTILVPPPTVSFTAPTNNAIIVAGSSVTVSASATSGANAADAVDFYLDGVPLGSAGAPFQINWTPGTPGSHILTAIARDVIGQISTPAAVSVFVEAALVNPVMIAPGSSGWKYKDDGSNQGTAWTNLVFSNENFWSNGVAQLGFGDGDEATLLRRTNTSGTIITYYFRKKFVVPSLNGITNVFLNVLRDDGAIAYLNGAEVFRSNLTNGTVSYTTLALSGVTGGNESIYYPTNFSPARLVVGTNILAIEVHQNSATSSDISLDVQLNLQGTWLGPAIIGQPTNQTVAPGSNATFSVSSLGTGPLFNRWFFTNGVAAGTNATLTISNAQTSNACFVIVSNLVGAVTSSVAVLNINLDADGDGMPNAWEIANGTNPNANDANADVDYDGMSNFQEYLAGTSPTNAASVLRIETPAAYGTNLVFWFTAMSNHNYTLQFNPGIGAGAWQKWQDVPAAPSNRIIWMTNGTGGTASRYYRIVTPMQP